MFKNLTNFGYERSKKEALGFYLAYLFLAIMLAAFAGGINALITVDGSFASGGRVGHIIVIFYCLGLAIYITYLKGLFKSFKVILLIVTSGILATLLGGIGGLLPIAFLSTFSNLYNSNLKHINNE